MLLIFIFIAICDKCRKNHTKLNLPGTSMIQQEEVFIATITVHCITWLPHRGGSSEAGLGGGTKVEGGTRCSQTAFPHCNKCFFISDFFRFSIVSPTNSLKEKKTNSIKTEAIPRNIISRNSCLY